MLYLFYLLSPRHHDCSDIYKCIAQHVVVKRVVQLYHTCILCAVLQCTLHGVADATCRRLQASDSFKASLLKAKAASDGGAESSGGVETHTDGVTALMVAAVGGHMVCNERVVPLADVGCVTNDLFPYSDSVVYDLFCGFFALIRSVSICFVTTCVLRRLQSRRSIGGLLVRCIVVLRRVRRSFSRILSSICAVNHP